MKAVALLIVLLAGCSAPVDEFRTDNLFVQVIADGNWTVATPLPIDDTTDAAFWLANLKVSQGKVGFSFDAETGQLFIEGTGSMDLEALSARAVKGADAFMDGTWTVAPEAEQLRIDVAGNVDQFTLTHNANSCRGRGCDAGAGPGNQVCDRNQSMSATGLETGVHWVRLQDGSRCTKAP